MVARRPMDNPKSEQTAVSLYVDILWTTLGVH